MFIGSPWSKHVPNGRQNDIRGGLLEAKWFPGMAFVVFGGSWVSIGPPGGFPEGLLVDLGSPLRSSVGPWVVFEGQLETFFPVQTPTCVLLGNRRAACTGSSFSRPRASIWVAKPLPEQSPGRCWFFSIGKKLAPIERLLQERLWHPGGWPRPRK